MLSPLGYRYESTAVMLISTPAARQEPEIRKRERAQARSKPLAQHRSCGRWAARCRSGRSGRLHYRHDRALLIPWNCRMAPRQLLRYMRTGHPGSNTGVISQ